ncbi:hypothetical protein VMA_003102 [Vibrio mimicus VM223]|nr:hypothetical protein VMA_003102 [Vibrio mimicus VM223]
MHAAIAIEQRDRIITVEVNHRIIGDIGGRKNRTAGTAVCNHQNIVCCNYLSIERQGFIPVTTAIG